MALPSAESPRRAPWRRDFRLLWTGETISSFGSQITAVALPLTAAALLRANAAQMGILAAAATLPNLLLSFYFGALADRLARRWHLLVWADLLRLALIGLIPLAALAGFLSVNLLIVIGFVTGAASVSFSITWSAYLPSVVPAGNLLAANSKLTASMTLAGLAGVSLAGALVQLLGAPRAMLIDAASFGISAWFLIRMRHRGDRNRQPRPPRRSMWQEVAEGLRYCAADARLRAIAGAAANLNLFSSIALALIVLYLNRVMRMPPVLVSLVFAAWGAGALAGSVLAPVLGRRFSEGRTIVGATAVFSVGLFAYPPVSGPVWFETTVIAAASVVLGCAVFVFDVHSAAMRQAITPDRLQGRAASAMSFLSQGVKPLGALAGGGLGEALGVRGALWFAAAGTVTSVLWTYWSPLRTGQPPADAAEPARSVPGPAA